MTIGNDLRYAVRQLRKSPGFTLAAVLTLALGIGVNAAMFSVIDQVLLRSVPFPHPSELVQISEVNYGDKVVNSSGGIPLPDVQDWQARSHAFQGIGYYSFNQPTVGGIDTSRLEPQFLGSTNFFKMLGVAPAMGRDFQPGENMAGKSHVLIIGYSLWRDLFHGDPHILGRAVPLNGTIYTVVGVLPQSFSFQGGDDFLFSPLATDSKELNDRGNGMLNVLGRLRPDASVADANRQLSSIKRQELHDFPGKERDTRVVVQSYQEARTGQVRPALLALDGAVLLVWLIACANVAGLMLTRTSGRRREIAVRNALGAGSARLLRQFLTESLVLALAGGAAGLALAWAALRVLRHYLDRILPSNGSIHIDAAVCAYLFAASCVSALVFGVLPALQAARAPAQEGLREGSAASGTSHRQRLLRDTLVTVEVTFTLLLLVAAGLVLRSLSALRHADLGFAPDHVVTAALVLPQKGYWFVTLSAAGAGPNVVQTFYTPLLDRVRQLPGVEAAGVSTVRPLEPNWNFKLTVEVVGRPKNDARHEQNAHARAATVGFFPAMGIRLLRGRLFTGEDAPGAPLAAVVNQAFARQFFPNGNPLGQQFKASDKDPHRNATIVGVVDDAKQVSASDPDQPEIFLDLDQFGPEDDLYPILVGFRANLAVRTNQSPAALIPALERIVHQVNGSVAVDKPQTMQQVVDDSMGSQVLAARLLSIFGLAALAIAVAGVYGLLAYQVSQRTREFGVRIALGAQRGDVLELVLRHALILLGIGMAVGLALALLMSRFIAGFLYQVNPDDLVTILSVTVILGACGLLASYLPARRASQVDPVEALRSE